MIFFVQETLSRIEQKINQVVGLKNALELVQPLHTILSAGVESNLFSDIRGWLEDEAYQQMLEKIHKIIHDDARSQKVTSNHQLVKSLWKKIHF